MTKDDSDFAIVRSVTDLARHLGLTVTAEGVEDRAAWDALTRVGCTLAQGYYLSRPLAAPDFDEWLKERPVPRPGVTPHLEIARLGA
jgi:EAL domain-containing protein (putative c-di-GMP-specific phosphodiesterase class I)